MLGYVIAQALYTQHPTNTTYKAELLKKIIISQNLGTRTSRIITSTIYLLYLQSW